MRRRHSAARPKENGKKRFSRETAVRMAGRQKVSNGKCAIGGQAFSFSAWRRQETARERSAPLPFLEQFHIENVDRSGSRESDYPQPNTRKNHAFSVVRAASAWELDTISMRIRAIDACCLQGVVWRRHGLSGEKSADHSPPRRIIAEVRYAKARSASRYQWGRTSPGAPLGACVGSCAGLGASSRGTSKEKVSYQ